MTESTLLSVIGVDTRLLEPLRRGSLRGRESGNAQAGCEFTGSWCSKINVFLSSCFMKILVDLGYPLGYHLCEKSGKVCCKDGFERGCEKGSKKEVILKGSKPRKLGPRRGESKIFKFCTS